MRWNAYYISILAAVCCIPGVASAASFGQVVPIGGSAADIALDETRGTLYIANFGAARIDKMSLSDLTIHSSISTLPFPGALALSQDSQFLLVANYANGQTSPVGGNAVTVINLANNEARQTFATGDAPLSVAFYCTSTACRSPQALIVTASAILSLDPVSGQSAVLSTISNLANPLPVAQATFPAQILQAAMSTSADGMTVWGIASAGSSTQLVYRFDARSGNLTSSIYVTSPLFLPRVSVAADGSSAMVGYSLLDSNLNLQGRYPNTIASTTITGSAIDTKHGVIYGQFPDANQPTGPAASSPASPAGSASSAKLPALLLMDTDNLTVQNRLIMPENMIGRALLNAAGSMLYAISDSGVMVLPVGSLNQFHQVAASVEDVLVASNFCNGSAITQSFTVADPGGNHTDFQVSTSQAGVTIGQSSGVTPATVQVRVDPTSFPSPGGTTAVTLTISSNTAVNQPNPVRLLVNVPDPSQRGTVVDQPGVLSDIVPDTLRNRYYVLRQDKNQLMVFDGASNSKTVTLRTATSPTMMALSNDQNYLLVGHNDSQYVTVYDLNAMARLDPPVILPGGHYARSIAASNSKLLVLARNEANGSGIIDTVDLLARTAQPLQTLGIFKNSVSPTAVLTTSPNGGTVLLASPDGNVMLYSADGDTWPVSRKDFSALSGAFAASDYGQYIVGNNLFNASLVPQGSIGASGAQSSGFAYVNQSGFLVSASSPASAGMIQQTQMNQLSVAPVLMSEAPLLPTASSTAASTSTGTGTGSSGASGASGASGSTGSTGTGTTTTTNGSGSTSTYALTSFTRTVAPMSGMGTVVVLSTSGVTVLASNYAAAVAPPQISNIVNAADGTAPVAPGGLISIYGSRMSPVNMATSQIPLPTALGDSCLSVNGTPVPLLFVSSSQINAQLPFNVTGNASLSIHTPGGISDSYHFSVQPNAPSVFQTASAGPQTGLAAIYRADNGQLVTPTNPIHPKDTVVIYLTGMGTTTPQVQTGMPSPSSPLAQATVPPLVTLGGSSLGVSYAGLVPGDVGVYQINATVPTGVTQGLDIPLVINQAGASTTLTVRVVN